MINSHPSMRRVRRGLALATLLLFTASCMSTSLPPISSYGGSFQPLKDERLLWEEARIEEAELLAHADLYDDPRLEAYLEEIVARLEPAGMAANPAVEVRVRVIEDPSANAFAYPHGSIYVHTGLLSAMENEDQLATVLAHEMSHVEMRHMVRHRRSAHNKRVGFGIAAVAAAVILAEEQWDAYGEGAWGRGVRIGILGDLFLGLGLELAVLAAVNGYGRDLEREADSGGLAKLTAAGYDLAEAPEAYRALMGDGEAAEVSGVFFFASHPKLLNRVENAEAWLAAHPEHEARPADPERFRERTAPVLLVDAGHQLELGRLELAERRLARALEVLPEEGEARELAERLRLARAEETELAARSESSGR